MAFTLIPKKPVLDFLRKNVLETKNEERKKYIELLLHRIDIDKLKVFFAFQNEYGEKYIVCGWDLTRFWWAGDESDWEFCKSFYEDQFVEELRQAELVRIKKNKIIKY